VAAGADTLLAAPAPDPRTEAAEALADSTPTFAPTGIFVVVRDRGVAPTRQPLPRLGGDRGRLTDPGAGGRRSAPGDCFIRSAGKLISVEAPREGVAVIGQGPTKGRQTGDRSLCQWMHQSLPAGLVSGPTCKSRAVSFRRLNSPPRPRPLSRRNSSTAAAMDCLTIAPSMPTWSRRSFTRLDCCRLRESASYRLGV